MWLHAGEISHRAEREDGVQKRGNGKGITAGVCVSGSGYIFFFFEYSSLFKLKLSVKRSFNLKHTLDTTLQFVEQCCDGWKLNYFYIFLLNLYQNIAESATKSRRSLMTPRVCL